MKIAVTVKEQNGLESRVARHFGHSPYFAFVELEDQKVSSIDVVANPYLERHSRGQAPAFVKEHGAEVVLSGGMGPGTTGHFKDHGIQTAGGASGTVQQTLDAYFKGELSEAVPCHDHEHHRGPGRGEGRRGGGRGIGRGEGRRGESRRGGSGRGEGRGQGRGAGRGEGPGQEETDEAA